MLKIRCILLFIGGYLLTSCSDELSQISNIVNPTGGSSIQKQRDQEKRENNTNLEIIFSKKLGQQNFSAITTSLASFKNQEERNGFTFHGLEISDEVMLQVFSHLSIKDLIQASQVCRSWYQLSEEPTLWRNIRAHIHGDYPANQATKEQAKLHMLRVHVNTLSELTTMERLITKYELNKNRPFVPYQALVAELINHLSSSINNLTDQNNELYVKCETENTISNNHSHKKNYGTIICYNEYLAVQGSEASIERKIEGLTNGIYGYEKDPEAAFVYNEYLVSQGNQAAIGRKVKGLTNGLYGYKKNPEAAFALNEDLISQGNGKAIGRKILGLTYGIYSYSKDRTNAFLLNENLVKQGDPEAVKRKIRGLDNGLYGGYKRDPMLAFTLNEDLVEQGNQKAIKRKIQGLMDGDYGYKKNPKAAVELNEYLIEQGNEGAIIRKIKALSEEEDKDLIEEGYLPLYEQNLPQLKSWIEEKANKGTRWACYLKANGLKYGILGFTKNSEAAIEYIKRYNIPY